MVLVPSFAAHLLVQAYPIYATHAAVVRKDPEELQFWTHTWSVVGLFKAATVVLDRVLLFGHPPGYAVLKLAVYIALTYLRAGDYVYRVFLAPFFFANRHEIAATLRSTYSTLKLNVLAKLHTVFVSLGNEVLRLVMGTPLDGSSELYDPNSAGGGNVPATPNATSIYQAATMSAIQYATKLGSGGNQQQKPQQQQQQQQQVITGIATSVLSSFLAKSSSGGSNENLTGQQRQQPRQANSGQYPGAGQESSRSANDRVGNLRRGPGTLERKGSLSLGSALITAGINVWRSSSQLQSPTDIISDSDSPDSLTAPASGGTWRSFGYGAPATRSPTKASSISMAESSLTVEEVQEMEEEYFGNLDDETTYLDDGKPHYE